MFGKYGLVLKNASYLTLFEVMRMAMPFIALPYLFRVVGEERYGTVVFAQAIVALFALFIHFGLDISAVRDVAIYRNNRERLNQIFSAVIFIKSTLALLVGPSLRWPFTSSPPWAASRRSFFTPSSPVWLTFSCPCGITKAVKT